jgi:hypothetical protein
MCDWGTAISAGVSLLGSALSSEGSGSDRAAADATTRGVALQERQFEIDEPYKRQQIAQSLAIGKAELPLQLRVIEEAAEAGTIGEQDAAAARATADTHAAIDATGATRARTLSSLGIAPGSPAYTAGTRTADAANAATLAKASTDAREGERVRGMEQRIRVAGQARGFNPNVSTVTNPGASLVQSGTALSNIAGQQHDREAAQRRDLGQAAGTIAERVFSSPGSSPPPQTTLSNSYNSTPYVDSGYHDFEQGGAVRGPAHTDGGVPIEAEGGEFVIKADTVRKYGPRLLAEVNEGTAIIIPTGSPRRLNAVA